MLPSNHKGSYILILHLTAAQTIRVGKLGEIDFPRGYYAYVGSALGPGGVAGRINHHLKPAKNPHWHIDYLNRTAKIKEIWISEGTQRREHNWASIFAEFKQAAIPAKGFGSSDCNCPAHLFYFEKRPQLKDFENRITIRENLESIDSKEIADGLAE